MFCDTRVERVGRNVLVVRQQTKFFLRNDKMQEAGHAANTAVAFRRLDIGSIIDLESNHDASTHQSACKSRNCLSFTLSP